MSTTPRPRTKQNSSQQGSRRLAGLAGLAVLAVIAMVSCHHQKPTAPALPATVFVKGGVFEIIPSAPGLPAIRTVTITNGTRLTFPIKERPIRGLSLRIRKDAGHAPIFLHVPAMGLKKDLGLAPRTVVIETAIETSGGKVRPLTGRWNPGHLDKDSGPYDEVIWEKQDK